MVLRKTISDKQFLYLVSAVLQSIVNYCIQFSFIPSVVCWHWDALVGKSFKFKAELLCNFPSKVLYHSVLYGLKKFKQIQAEKKSESVVAFANAFKILSRLFEHRFLDLQVLGWASLNLLQYPVWLYGPVLFWFVIVSKFLHDAMLTLVSSDRDSMLDVDSVLLSGQFSNIKGGLLKIWLNTFTIYMNGFLKELGFVDVTRGAIAFFPKLIWVLEFG
ncbi:hypothetical protein G9A89_008616 [Geosiphon pyriformis]|nr:hypothetical protein G9A89_008616 [Geosiphon pyriformis]